ncbi:Fido domain containing protein [Flavobacteriaceae bacterium]
MENILQNRLPELLYSSSDSATSQKISKLEKSGKIRKIAPRIYTSNLEEPSEAIIRRNIFKILGNQYPNAVLSHRSALEFKPTSADHLFVTYKYTRKIELPGVTLRFLEGHGPIGNDNKFSGELYVSQKERAFLENLQVSRQPGPKSKTLTLPEIEEKLESIVRINGEEGLNEIRDRAKAISEELEMQAEFEKLNKMIGALLTTKPSKILSSPVAIARAYGNPFDKYRIQLFETLFVALKQKEFPNRPDQNTATASFRNFAFFEAYFSNYIEGTKFELDEAKQIIKSQTPMPDRDEDSHDILGTYNIVRDKKEMGIIPTAPDDLLKIIQYRHEVLLSARTSKKPGQFKDINNRAGETLFVDFNLVRGTLTEAFNFYQALDNPFSRAAYIMFIISEIHPFLDGNGRIARVMMNAELVATGQTRIIIPTVYRDDYLGALRRLTRNNDPEVYIRMLQRAQEFCATLDAADMDKLEGQIEASNAFKEHDESRLKF